MVFENPGSFRIRIPDPDPQHCIETRIPIPGQNNDQEKTLRKLPIYKNPSPTEGTERKLENQPKKSNKKHSERKALGLKTINDTYLYNTA